MKTYKKSLNSMVFFGKRATTLVAVLVLMFSGVGIAEVIVDFEDLGLAPGDRIDPPDFVPIISGGFSFAPTPNSSFNDVHAGNSRNNWSFNGTTVLLGHDEILMTDVNGGVFSLISFDFAGWPTNFEVPFSVIANTGATADFTPDGLVDGLGGIVDFETFVLPPGFSNITSAKFVHTGAGTDSGIFALDNIVVREPAIEVAVDIKPRFCPNRLNVKSHGMLHVAILGSEDFDVNTIDVASIRLADVAPIRSSYRDVATPVADANECECTTTGRDGHTDLSLKFRTQEIVEALGEVVDGEEWILNLTGVLLDDTPIEGSDCILIMKKGKGGGK